MVAEVTNLSDVPTDGDLVVAARSGDRSAKAELFRRHASAAAGVAYRLLGGDSELEDIVQESFITALAGLHKLNQPQAFRAWMTRIVVGTTIATIRRRRLLTKLGLLRSQPVQLETLIAREAPPDVSAELRKIYRVLDELPTAERAILVLRRVERHSLVEVAEHTGWSLATVKRKLARADRMLAALTNEEDE